MRIVLFVILLLCGLKGKSQERWALSAGEIRHRLEGLQVFGSVLYIAAHPDDENTRLLTWLSKEKHLRTGYLSLTRGEGGQNLIGSEQGAMLGMIRTQELLAARRIDGAEQFFTRAVDFGYSKNPEETLRMWNKDSVLADMVWVIRTFKPDVIICRFPTSGEGGHGHHTASAILAEEAWSAAADPKRFAQQLRYTEPWQAKRLFWNTFQFGTVNTTGADQLKINIGAYYPLLGESTGEIAARSRSMHKSQGFGTAGQLGELPEYFKQLKGEKVKRDLFEGLVMDWSRVGAPVDFRSKVSELINNFDDKAPEKSITSLVELYQWLGALPEKDAEVRHWVALRQNEIRSLILSCAGWHAECLADAYSLTPGQEFTVRLQCIQRRDAGLRLIKLRFHDTNSLVAQHLETNKLYTFTHRMRVPAASALTNPFWLNKPVHQNMYQVPMQALVGKAENDPVWETVAEVELGGIRLNVPVQVMYKEVDPVKGERNRGVEILPAVSLSFSTPLVLLTGKKASIGLKLSAQQANQRGQVILSGPPGLEVNPRIIPFFLEAKGSTVEVTSELFSGVTKLTGQLRASVVIGNDTLKKSIHRASYDHIPEQLYMTDAAVNVRQFDCLGAGGKIGFINGSGEDTPVNLRQLGFEVEELKPEQLSSEVLAGFRAVITGIRAFNSDENLYKQVPVLLDYVKQGGNLLVQYNTNSRIGPLNGSIGPYPFTISRGRVTDETAKVRILAPQHPALLQPNKISEADFNGWVQERGLYFATDTDTAYTKLLSMNDPGEAALDGSLLVTAYGKGNFVYTGLSFFRQLPAGVPGAYRLFVNLLNLPSGK